MSFDLSALAQDCLRWLHDKALQIDNGQAEAIDDGFAWWPGPVQQTIRASNLEPNVEAVLLEITTKLWKSSEPPSPEALDQVQELCTLSALSYSAEEMQLSFQLLIYPELADWQLRFASWVASVQVAEAADIVHANGAGLPGGPFLDGPAGEFDSIVEVRRLVRDRGENHGSEILTVETVAAAARAIDAELKETQTEDVFALHRPWTVLPREAMEAGFDGHSIVSYVGLARHPQVGRGFGLRSFFPLPVDSAIADHLVATLNTEQGWLAPRVGAWIASEERLLIQTFLPAGMLQLDGAGILLGNVLSYHERMMRPGLEVLIDLWSSEKP